MTRLLILVAVFVVGGCRSNRFQGEELRPQRRAMNIQATLGDGRAFELRDLAGKVVLLSFGYTSCPDVCPLTLSRVKALYRALGDDADQVGAVFLTVDPERDTPERLHGYVSGFDPRIVGVSLQPVAQQQVLAAYGVTATRREVGTGVRKAAGQYYAMDHTSGFLLIDRQGWLRVRAPHDLPIDKLAQDVRALLSEKAPARDKSLVVQGAKAQVGPTGVGAVYFELHNPNAHADRLLRVESASAARVELHEVRHEDGVAKMLHHPEGFDVPADGALELVPGGRHLMLFDVAPDAKVPIDLVLHFSKAPPLQVSVPRVDPSAFSER